jgi:hypothetical protein
MTQASTQAPPSDAFYSVRYLRKDVGVAIVVVAALLLGFGISRYVDSRTATFAATDQPFSITYPAGWVPAESLLEAPLMKVQDPLTESAFKTSLTVDSRELDPAAPPTLQDLLDRRVEQRQALTGYHFLSNNETTVGGERAMQYDYTYVVQPADQPRRASLPVVVVAREYIVLGKDHVYYLAFATPEQEVERTLGRLEAIVQTVKLQ